jgi:hypothetical protein
MTGAHSFDERHLFPRVLSAPAATDPPLPSHWEPIDPAHGDKHLLQLTKEKHSAELAEVEQHWQQTDGDGTIVRVHRIQNPALHRRFEGTRRQTPGLVDTIAYHGTRLNAPALIYDSPTGFSVPRGSYAPGSVPASCTGGGETVRMACCAVIPVADHTPSPVCMLLVAPCGLLSTHRRAAAATSIESVRSDASIAHHAYASPRV